MPVAKKKLTGRQALVQVLRTCTSCSAVAEEGARKCASCGAALKPMKTKELCAEAVAIAPGLKGKTPEATMAATLAVSNKRGGEFVRTAPGEYDLRERHGRRRARAAS